MCTLQDLSIVFAFLAFKQEGRFCWDPVDGSGIVSLPVSCFFLFFFKHMCMRVNLFNNGQNCSVGWSAGLFKWIVMLCNNLNNEVSLISKVRTKLLILWVHYKIYPL